jgi:hypothetical protein
LTRVGCRDIIDADLRIAASVDRYWKYRAREVMVDKPRSTVEHAVAKEQAVTA